MAQTPMDTQKSHIARFR